MSAAMSTDCISAGHEKLAFVPTNQESLLGLSSPMLEAHIIT